MKKLEILAVRILPIIISIYLLIKIIMAYNGVNLIDYNYLFGHSIGYDFLLLLLSFNNKRYHCVYNRALISNLIFIDILGALDNKLTIINDANVYLMIISTSFAISGGISILMAFNHFSNVNKTNNNRHA